MDVLYLSGPGYRCPVIRESKTFDTEESFGCHLRTGYGSSGILREPRSRNIWANTKDDEAREKDNRNKYTQEQKDTKEGGKTEPRDF
jgi:hypothetical protein